MKKYTFVAEVQPTPKDKDIMYMINMIREAYRSKAIIKREASNENDYKYTIKIGEQIVNINNKEELQQALKDSYKVEKVENLEQLQYNILNLIQDRIIYGARTDKNRGRILNTIFPNLEQFQESFVKLKRFGIEDKLYEGMDLKKLSFSELSNRAIEMVEIEEQRIKEKQAAEEIKRREEEERKRKEAKEAREIKRQQNKKDTVFALKKEHIAQQVKPILDNVQNTYYELKQEEIKFLDLARRLGLNYSITKIDETNIHSSIEQIKRNMEKISEQVERIDDIEKLEKIRGVLQELENLTKDTTIKNQYSVELKEKFEKSFDAKVQELIINSKVSKLEEQREEVESEKVTFIGKLVGKVKLKQTRLDNINLKMQLLMLENKSNKMSYTLEDSLADLYTYSQCGMDKSLTEGINEFLNIIKEESLLKEMINEEKLNNRLNEKVNSLQSEIQLIPPNDNGKISNRYQANILELQNNDMNRQIQNNRARTVIRQNDLLSVTSNSNSQLNKFQNIVNQINIATQLKDTKNMEIEQ